MLNFSSTLLAAISPPAFANRFSEVKAQPGLLYFHVWAQSSAFENVPEPITLFKRPLMMLPIDVVVAAVADVAEEVAPVVPSTEVDVDFLVEV